MKKIGILLLCVLLAGLTACTVSEKEEEPFSAAFTIRETSAPTEVFFGEPVPAVGSADLPDSLSYDAIEHLFVTSLFGDQGQVLCLWNQPIQYALNGGFSQMDAQTAGEIADALSDVSGFPGIRETTADQANVQITFADVPAADCNIAADSNGNILRAEITIPTNGKFDRAKALRQSLFRICGMLYHAETVLDTVNAESYAAAKPTDTDWMLMDILYSEMQAGMSKEECRTALDAHFKAQ